MAKVDLKKPDFYDRYSAAQLAGYLRGLVDDLEYILNNIDEKNLTSDFRKKIDKNKEDAPRG
ncbi:MAG: hypothetical protein ILO42_07535 [Clostridia bacterium]|nr:hypothetical protein [Clostridia bacterium]